MKLSGIKKWLLTIGAAAFLTVPLGQEVFAQELDEMPLVTQAAGDTVGTDSTQQDVNPTVIPVAPEGSAVLEEQIQENGDNVITEPEKFVNDAEPVVSDQTAETPDTGDGTQDGNTGSEGTSGSGQEGQEGTGEGTPAEQPEVENAIEKAVSKALVSADKDTRELTVTISDGIYNGDIQITKDKLGMGVDGKNITMYLLAEGSYQPAAKGGVIDKNSITAGAGGQANVNGNIIIDGINVVLAGLYYSLNNTITVKDSVSKIYGTSKDDNVQLVLDSGADVTVTGGGGSDGINITGTPQGETQGAQSKASLNGGEGSDIYTVDMSSAKGKETSNKTAISIQDADGGRLHLTGELNTAQDKKPSGDYNETAKEAELNLINKDGFEVVIHAIGLESFTDALKNKLSVALSDADFTNGKYTIENAFTDYIYKTDNIGNLTVSGGGLLSTLYVNGNELTIGSLDASGVNLTLTGKKITISGAVKGKNIIMNAHDDDIQFVIPISQTGIGKDIPVSVMDVKSSAVIKITNTGSVTAGKSVVMTADSSQTKPLLPIGDGFNFISVKIGEAIIDIAGIIDAGGEVVAKAVSAITAGASNTSLAKWFIPLAVGVMIGEAGVFVRNTGKITAAGDIRLRSDSTITVTTASTTGALPILPKLANMASCDNVFVLTNIPSLDKIIAYQKSHEVKKVTVVGGGFIGIEVAENLS
ncbi:MAG: hypothetical protein EOM18_06075, partial [Clostridia bacterium]|nr:hypothetical protein [Clostridia bacterium]